jgi:hypothetical protein
VGTDRLLYWVSQWWLAVALFVILVVALEVGLRAGRRERRRYPEEEDSSTPTGAVLGLLALLLAFTYALAAGHYDRRKELVLEEANALGTAWLRTEFLKAEDREELRGLLREYLDLRLRFAKGVIDEARITSALDESGRLHAAMWAVLARSAASHVPTVMDAILANALNDVIDAHQSRVHAARDQVPALVLYMLIAVAIVSVAMVGYNGGRKGRCGRSTLLLLPGLIVAVTIVTIDLDRPRRGLVTVSEQDLIDLRPTFGLK